MQEENIEVFNPNTLSKITEIKVASAAEVGEAVARARHAQKPWAKASFRERAQLLYRLRDLLIDEEERMADILTAETGRPRAEASGNELFYLCDAIGVWAKKSAHYLRPKKIHPHFPLMKGKQVSSTYCPRGVIGIISPWNFPLTLTLGEALPALMAGNAVVIKPSELTPLSALFGAEMARKAGFPENLLQVVNGRAATAEALIDRVDMISFTGSVATGRHVMKRAAERLTPVSLELGGKDPMLVLKDADLERAAGACVWGALMNSGQACTSIERVYVEAPVYDAFLDRVCDKARGVRQGPSEESLELGSMTSDTQLRKVSAQLEDAIQRGAKVLVGGKRNDRYPGLYFEPTVLANVSHEMRIMNEETFGPVIPIMKVNDPSEAIRLANDSSYGLGASIFSRDRENALRMAEQLDCGTVCVNDALVNYIIPDAPMGGMKESGFGYRHGPDGIRKYCRQQTIVVDRFGLREEFPWYPNSAKKSRQLHHLLRLLCRSGWRNKWAALVGLMKA